jgi:GntR family transcriptional regulator/MocR family aminotransferase
VLVTQGSQQGIALAGLVLTDPWDDVLVEEPGYFAARGAMLLAGANPVSVPVDLRGADLPRALRDHPAARLAVLTPGRQLPLGVSLSTERRDLDMDWANRDGGWVVEDDYAADLRQASDTPPLRARPDGAAVVYVGTFSKVLFPSLRLGYLVLPEALVEPFARARTFLDYHPPYLEQAVTAAFLAEGHFERHVRRVRTALGARRELLKTALAGPLRGLAEIDAPDGFWHMLVQMPPRWSGDAVARAAAGRGLDVMPLSRFTASGKAPSALLLGFSGLREDELRAAASTLVDLIRDLARTGAALSPG